MLPVFPLLKEEIQRMLVLGVRLERPDVSSLLPGFARTQMHEGSRVVFVRETGEEQEISLNEYKAEEIMDMSEVELLTLSEVYNRYRDVTSKIEKQAAADLEDLVDRTAESIGNVVQLGSRPLAEGILEGVEPMLMLDDPRDVVLSSSSRLRWLLMAPTAL
jgi:hypothetical protein